MRATHDTVNHWERFSTTSFSNCKKGGYGEQYYDYDPKQDPTEIHTSLLHLHNTAGQPFALSSTWCNTLI